MLAGKHSPGGQIAIACGFFIGLGLTEKPTHSLVLQVLRHCKAVIPDALFLTLGLSAERVPCEIRWAGELLSLLPERALWWPAGRVLFIADLHLGKAASYRALGQPVPAGTTRENIGRLRQLLLHYKPAQLVFLGDFMHSAASRTPSVLNGLTAWREQFSGLDCVLVRGNHDSRAGDPPDSLQFRVVNEPFLVGPFAACHHPQTHATHSVLAGHLHPALGLHGAGRDSVRLPCFSFDERSAVLPAFGEFTGGWTVPGQPGRNLYPIGGEVVWRLPPR